MTEQEKREEAIEEMAKIMWGNRYNDDCFSVSCTDCEFSGQGRCSMYKRIGLYDAGYRKADEVRKEIFDKLIEVSKNFDGNLPLWALKAWAIEFGVEVDE